MPNWQDLEFLITQHVPAGTVTTYGDLSAHFFNGNRGCGRPVGSMLKALAAHAAVDLSHRVVRDDGSMPPGRAGGAANQQAALAAEGVAFNGLWQVELVAHRAQLP